jgi:hypothetical protein
VCFGTDGLAGTIVTVSGALARLRGFAGFSVWHPFLINGLAGKVCTTAGGE